MSEENITNTLKDAKDSDILIGGKYDSDIYRLVYILNRLVEVTGFEKLIIYKEDDIYTVYISNRTEPGYLENFNNTHDFVQNLKDLIHTYYNKAVDISTRCMTASSLAQYYRPMLKLKLEGDK